MALAHIHYMSINYLYQLYDGTWQLFSQWPINFQFWAQRALNITIIREKRNCTYKMVHTHIWTCNVTYHLWGGPCPTPRLVGIIGLLSPGTLDHVLPYDCPIHSTDSFSGRLLVRKSATNNFFSFICTAVVTDSLFNFQIYNNQAINKHNKFFLLLNFSKKKKKKVL